MDDDDVIIFYDAEGNPVLTLPADDVDAIVPESAMREKIHIPM